MQLCFRAAAFRVQFAFPMALKGIVPFEIVAPRFFARGIGERVAALQRHWESPGWAGMPNPRNSRIVGVALEPGTEPAQIEFYGRPIVTDGDRNISQSLFHAIELGAKAAVGLLRDFQDDRHRGEDAFPVTLKDEAASWR